MYPDAAVEKLINGQFVPVRYHVKENPEGFERFGAEWTPTIIVADAKGHEHHRIEGFLPSEDFLAQLNLAIAHTLRGGGEFAEAERRYRELAADDSHPDVAAESLYWAGVARYKATEDASALAETARAFQQRFTDTAWAKKASVWAGS